MSTTRILLDVDPGHDDALAILAAAGLPGVEIAAITTVGGNQTLEKVTRNALAVATVAGLEGVVVAAGCDRPLVSGAVLTDSETHGESGLDGPDLPAPTVALDPRHGVDVIVETVMTADPGTVTLVPTGPLTNVAAAVRREPEIAERVAEVVLMGGGFTKGNVTPAAEFNIYTDPEAAHIVFTAPWRVTMVGLDLTHQALATPRRP
ncbi:nucleoside hydrolase [Georgenia sp. SUBG003]|uniref:nucleoside hydrolase n=1 Tax=Georgenia sp. SUBG003 TaxID=1497974 RepID=UPI000B0C1C48